VGFRAGIAPAVALRGTRQFIGPQFARYCVAMQHPVCNLPDALDDFSSLRLGYSQNFCRIVGRGKLARHFNRLRHDKFYYSPPFDSRKGMASAMPPAEKLVHAPQGRSYFGLPTQAKERLEWATRQDGLSRRQL
jgi:hypothetical protein